MNSQAPVVFFAFILVPSTFSESWAWSSRLAIISWPWGKGGSPSHLQLLRSPLSETDGSFYRLLFSVCWLQNFLSHSIQQSVLSSHTQLLSDQEVTSLLPEMPCLPSLLHTPGFCLLTFLLWLAAASFSTCRQNAEGFPGFAGTFSFTVLSYMAFKTLTLMRSKLLTMGWTFHSGFRFIEINM